jgi:hypothetical protein
MSDIVESMELGGERAPEAVNHTVVILDSSGSMANFGKQPLDALNEQIQAARAVETRYQKRLSIVTFSTMVDAPVVWNKDVLDVEDLMDYRPDGMTALYDAIGSTFTMLERYDVEGSSFLVLIITDGLENNSKQYDESYVQELIESKKSKGNWTITYQGTGHNVFKVAQTLHIDVGNTQSFVNTQEGFIQANQARRESTVSYYSALGGAGGQSVSNFYSDEAEEDGEET